MENLINYLTLFLVIAIFTMMPVAAADFSDVSEKDGYFSEVRR